MIIVIDSIKNEFTTLTEKLTNIINSEAQTISSTLQDISQQLAAVEDSKILDISSIKTDLQYIV